MIKRIRYGLEAAGFAALYGVFALLPLDTASAFGGWLARRIGPCLGAHYTARRNLAMALPEKSESEREDITRRMWDHLGRTAAEFAHHRGNALVHRTTFRGLENTPPPGIPALFVSGHLGNWELTYPTAYEHGVPLTLIYRHINNPYVDRYVARTRAAHSSNMFPKGLRGAVQMAKALKGGESLALLVDQKMNTGIAVPFFGRDAMTAPAIAQLALKYKLPILPARVVRLNGAHFTSTVFPPLRYDVTGDTERDTLAILTALHALLEAWIRETPEQWFWVHNRWPKEG